MSNVFRCFERQCARPVMTVCPEVTGAKDNTKYVWLMLTFFIYIYFFYCLHTYLFLMSASWDLDLDLCDRQRTDWHTDRRTNTSEFHTLYISHYTYCAVTACWGKEESVRCVCVCACMCVIRCSAKHGLTRKHTSACEAEVQSQYFLHLCIELDSSLLLASCWNWGQCSAL